MINRKTTVKSLLAIGFQKDENWYIFYFDVKHQNNCKSITSFSLNIKDKKAMLGSNKCMKEAWNVEIKYPESIFELRTLLVLISGKDLTKTSRSIGKSNKNNG